MPHKWLWRDNAPNFFTHSHIRMKTPQWTSPCSLLLGCCSSPCFLLLTKDWLPQHSSNSWSIWGQGKHLLSFQCFCRDTHYWPYCITFNYWPRNSLGGKMKRGWLYLMRCLTASLVTSVCPSKPSHGDMSFMSHKRVASVRLWPTYTIISGQQPQWPTHFSGTWGTTLKVLSKGLTQTSVAWLRDQVNNRLQDPGSSGHSSNSSTMHISLLFFSPTHLCHTECP